MKKRRKVLEVTENIYFFLKNNKSKEYSINKISNQMKIRYELTIKCLNHLKKLDLVKERKGDKKPIPERLFNFKR